MNLFSRGILELIPRARFIWLYPQQVDTVPQQASIDGHVELTLSRSAAISEITVRLLGEATVATPGRESKGVVQDRRVTVYKSDGGHKLPSGRHCFEFCIPIDSTAPTALVSRVAIGSIHYRLFATAGPLRTEVRMAVVSCSTERGARASTLDVQVQDATEALGALRLQWLSSRFTAGAIFETRLELVEVPSAVTLLGGSVWLIDRLGKRHFDNHGQLETFEHTDIEGHCLSQLKEYLDVWTDGEKQVAPIFPLHLPPGRRFRLQHYARLPSAGAHRHMPGAKMRYTFPKETVTPIRSTYELRFRLDFRVASNPTPCRLEIQRAVDIGTCLLVDENVILPEYEEARLETSVPTEAPRVFASAADWGSQPSERCICLLPFDELLAEHLALTSESELDETGKDHKAVI